MKKVDLFVDSGAFSAWNKGIEVDIQDYIQFIYDNKNHISQYSVLDVIGDAEGTLQNQKIMEEAGLSPLPCFHFGESLKYLKHYVDNYEYITIGGMVSRAPKDLFIFLNSVFDIVCDKSGAPQCKTHGFGITSIQIMKSYPWYSVDSARWIKTARMGAVLVPRRLDDGTWDILEHSQGPKSREVSVSSLSPLSKKVDGHISTVSSKRQREVLDWIHEHGFCLGESEFKDVKKGYVLASNEKFINKEKNKVEVILKAGVSNTYQLRDAINILFFQEVQALLPAYPWNWKRPALKGFGV